MKKFLLTLLCLLAVGASAMAEETKSDIISPETIKDFKTTTAYTTWTNAKFDSDAEYTFKATRNYVKADSYYAIQFGYNANSSKSAYHSGFVTTASGGSKAKVTIKWGSKGTKDRTLNFYESNSPFTSLDDLFSDGLTASKTLTSATSGEASVEISSPYFGIRPNDAAIEISSIEITWDVEESNLQENGLAYDMQNYNITFGDDFQAPQLINPNNLPVAYSSSNEKVAIVDNDGNLTILSSGTTTIYATFAGNETYKAGSTSYELTVKKAPIVIPTPGENSILLEFVSGNMADGSDIKAETTLNDFLAQGADYISSFDNFDKVWYNVEQGLRIGSSSNPGKITFNFDSEYAIESMVAYCQFYGSDTKAGIKINNELKTIESEGEVTFTYSDLVKTSQLIIETDKSNSAKPRLYIRYVLINYRPIPAAPAIADEHLGDLDENGVLTKAAETYTLKFKKVEGVDIYYRHIYKETASNEPEEVVPDAPLATRADEATAEEDIHAGYTKMEDADYENGITLTQNHSAIEYYAFANGVKSGEPTTLAVNLTDAGGTVGVAEIEAAGEAEARWFDLQGREVVKPATGLYIRVAGGKAQKVIVK